MAAKYLLFNQMAGPLFRELAFELAERQGGETLLFTGHPDTVELGPQLGALTIVPMPAYDRRSIARRLLSWLNYTTRALLRMITMPRSSVALVVSNPPIMGPVLWLAGLLGRRYFVLVYDLHPDTLEAMGSLPQNGVIARIWRALNKRVWNRAEGVFTIGGRMARRLTQQFDPSKTKLGKVEVIPVWADTNNLKPLPRAENSFAKELGVEDKTVVLYSGNMGISHDIDSILSAAELLKDQDDIAFVLIGEGAKWQEAYDFKHSKNLTNLQVLPFQPEDRLPQSLSMADISLVALDPGAENLMIPSKTFYYMAVGSAILAICQDGSELSDVIADGQCGLVMAPGKPEKLASAIVSLADNKSKLDQMKTNAREYCLTHHSRELCTSQFVDLLVSIESHDHA